MIDLRTLLFQLVLFYFITLNLLYFGLWVGAFFYGRRSLRKAEHTNFDRIAASPLTIPISVVIPSYNEELSVLDLVYSILNSEHPEVEIIVVDDGSTDKTIQILREEFDLEQTDAFYPTPLESAPVRRTYRSLRWPSLMVIEKDNGGKADAVNAGVNMARYRYVMVTDADTLLHPDALLRASNVINQDPACIIGVAGQIRVKNGFTVQQGRVTRMALPRSIVARFQMMEYSATFFGNRVGWNVLNATPIVSGAFGIWRRDVMIKVGGMSTKTTHEDLEFTFRVHADQRESGEKYGIVLHTDLIVWTEVPEDWGDVYNQRKRWQRVVYEVVYNYRHMIFNRRYGLVGLVTMPYLFLYEAAGPWVEVASYLVVIWLMLTGWLEPSQFGLFLVASFGLSAVLRILGLILDARFHQSLPPRAVLKLSGLALLENLVYRPITLAARLHAFYEFIRKKKTWERMKRVEGYGGGA